MTEAESEELGSQLRRLSSEKVWLEILEADPGPDDPIIAESKINLAESYFQQCQYKDAEELYKQVLTKAHEKFRPINGDNKSIWQVAEDREENKRQQTSSVCGTRSLTRGRQEVTGNY